MPTRTGYGAPQLPHRPQHKPRPEQNQSLTPNRPHAAEPTRKALVTRESSRLFCDLAISLANRTAGPRSQSWLTMMAPSYYRSYVVLTKSKGKLTSAPFSCPPAFTLLR